MLGQEVAFELWDYDPGFPGTENDDFLGRWLFLLSRNLCAIVFCYTAFPSLTLLGFFHHEYKFR